MSGHGGDAARPAEDVLAVLAAHRLTWRTITSVVCTCQTWWGHDDAAGKLTAPVRRQHDAHIAAALAEAGIGSFAEGAEAVVAAVEAVDVRRMDGLISPHAIAAARAAVQQAGGGA